MAQQEIEIKILPDGTIDIDMVCFKGQSCEKELKKIVSKLGHVVSSKKKQEYYDNDPKVHITE